jgi:regulator of protease activity HflC (stomatin/prohibitin superfamily)
MQVAGLVVLIAVAALLVRVQFTRYAVPEGFVALLYRDGKYERLLSAGAHWVHALHTRVSYVDLRERTVSVPGQEVLSRDQVSLKVSLLLTFRVQDPERAEHAVQDYTQALYAEAQLALRSHVAGLECEALVSERLPLGTQLQQQVAASAAAYGLSVQRVDLKDVMLPAELKRVFTEVLRAKKEGLAALEKARAESAALRSLANAARLVEAQPALLNLRVLQTLGDSGQRANSTFVMGVPFGLTPAAPKAEQT